MTEKLTQYRIESDITLESDWMPAEAFKRTYSDRSAAIAAAIEGVEDPKLTEVRVVDVKTGEVVWRSTEHKYR